MSSGGMWGGGAASPPAQPRPQSQRGLSPLAQPAQRSRRLPGMSPLAMPQAPRSPTASPVRAQAPMMPGAGVAPRAPLGAAVPVAPPPPMPTPSAAQPQMLGAQAPPMGMQAGGVAPPMNPGAGFAPPMGATAGGPAPNPQLAALMGAMYGGGGGGGL